MISTAKLLANSTQSSATAATSTPPMAATTPAAASATTATATATAAATATSPFDCILTLEALAATCAALDAGAASSTDPTAGAGLGGTDDLPGGDIDKTDDAQGSDAENPLAFLAGLLNAAVVTPQPQQQGAATNTDSDGDDPVADVLAGKGHRALVPMTDMPISLQPQAGASDVDAGAAGPLAGSLAAVAADAAATKLLTAIAPAALPDPNPARSDPGQAPDAATANLARAVELLSHGPRHAAPAARDVISTPVRDPNWAQDLGTRVAMMVKGGESTASLQLSPVDLGPVEVNVVVRDSHATVHFGAAQAETRALLEASIPRLREMLASQGFNLMDASVSQGFARQPRAEPPALGRQEVETEAEVRTTARVTPLGMLDTYA